MSVKTMSVRINMAIMSKSACQVTCHSLSYCFEIEHGSILHIGNIGSFTMQFISREACEISHILQVHFFFLHNAKSHEGHEGNEGRQEGGSTSPNEEGHESHLIIS